MLTEIILLERIETLGKMGELVKVKPGYARNFLLPQKKALRATKENIAYFEAQRQALETQNNERRTEAEKFAKKIDGLKVVILRQASESGQLYGSVSSRDIADALTEASGETVSRSQVDMNSAIKAIGMFPIKISLHPEVKVMITLNIARSMDEAKTQEKTGKAVIVDHNADDRKVAPAAKQAEAPEEEAEKEEAA
ncbi:MAG: 50S ribosomal protein L9 [Alphaproteobacteria bacterium]|jgi:large subunit ribosomal protein L9|nr:50S ribosomal protein L9 [Alphaproteobacteria bacterium]MCB9985622.1 50S ribosomal protein L9 [Micavibrio sp.]HPQ50728.1 50S ribosomal protein L9 [Alphaproteobacteria bacterium]HRK98338.1 50S ribosomal protein L9 [Alphaproteobacteria bacterium]